MQTNMLVRRGILAVVVATLALGSAAATVQAEDADHADHADGGRRRPAAQIDISPWAKETARSSFRFHYVARCAAGNVVQELVFEYQQGDFTHSEQGPTSLVCDGGWHRFQWTAPESAFDPGPAVVTARLTVVDQVTGDPRRQAVDTQEVWIKPAAKVRIGSDAKLVSGGAKVKMLYTCDQPWVPADLSVQLTQDAGTVAASGFVLGDALACDDQWHAVWVRLTGSGLHRGTGQLDASLSLLDPEFFDPVTTATTSGTVRVVR